MQLHWHSYKSLTLCLWIRYANENINLYRKIYFLQMSWAQMMMMMFISCHMQDGRLHSDWKIQNCGWEPLFKSFGQLKWNFLFNWIFVEVGRACFFRPGPSQAKIFSSRASLELLIFCFKPLQAKNFCIRAYFEPKKTSLNLTTPSKLGSH